MKIEFYDKETLEVCYLQNIFVVDKHGCVFEDMGKSGLYYRVDIGWRIVE